VELVSSCNHSTKGSYKISLFTIFFFEAGSSCVPYSGLELAILLPLECQDYRCAPPHMSSNLLKKLYEDVKLYLHYRGKDE
jgi:hypothetical protein